MPDNATITIDKYTHFKNKVYEYNLDGVWDMKPLFDVIFTLKYLINLDFFREMR